METYEIKSMKEDQSLLIKETKNYAILIAISLKLVGKDDHPVSEICSPFPPPQIFWLVKPLVLGSLTKQIRA